MNPNKALWEKGDFTRIAQSMRESGEALARSLGITSGLEVLDLGCGDGTTALPQAKLGARVLGVDIAKNLVEAGNRRAREQGLASCRFQEGDAVLLPVVTVRLGPGRFRTTIEPPIELDPSVDRETAGRRAVAEFARRFAPYALAAPDQVCWHFDLFRTGNISPTEIPASASR